jgi:excisionase family DNA binding protein
MTGPVIVTDETTLSRIVAEAVAREVRTLRDSMKGMFESQVPETGLMDPRQLAKYLDVNERTLRRMIRAGEVPAAVRIGTKILRWRRDAIDHWLESGAPPLRSRGSAGSVSAKGDRRS